MARPKHCLVYVAPPSAGFDWLLVLVRRTVPRALIPSIVVKAASIVGPFPREQWPLPNKVFARAHVA